MTSIKSNVPNRISSGNNHNVVTKSESSPRQIFSQAGNFDFKKNIAAIERVNIPQSDSKNQEEGGNVADSNRGGDSDYVYSPSSDAGDQQEQIVKKGTKPIPGAKSDD
jgi:hypothetical protein